MTVTLRAAAPADAPFILDLIRELAAYERLSGDVSATEADIRRDLFGPQPRVFAIVAESGGEPAGFALWFQTYSTFQGRHGLYLEDLFVRPSFRGAGVGRALVAHLARLCVSEGFERLEWSVLGWNEPSIRFYRSLGATQVDGWDAYRLSGDALAALGRA